jgi:hypothetical protein
VAGLRTKDEVVQKLISCSSPKIILKISVWNQHPQLHQNVCLVTAPHQTQNSTHFLNLFSVLYHFRSSHFTSKLSTLPAAYIYPEGRVVFFSWDI